VCGGDPKQGFDVSGFGCRISGPGFGVKCVCLWVSNERFDGKGANGSKNRPHDAPITNNRPHDGPGVRFLGRFLALS
jgi:hypothetical protein